MVLGQVRRVLGQHLGLLFGSAMIVVPGVGPVLFAGWIVAALQGALVVGGVAALGGALTTIGVPDISVVRYESAIKAGSFLVLAHGTEHEALSAKELLSHTYAVQVDSFSCSTESAKSHA